MNAAVEKAFAAWLVEAGLGVPVHTGASADEFDPERLAVIVSVPDVEHSAGPLHRATINLIVSGPAYHASLQGYRENEWSPYVKHHVFWNLVHAVSFEPPATRRENLTLFTGLAGGVADGIINQMLATINDQNAALSEFLGNRTIEGRFWSI